MSNSYILVVSTALNHYALVEPYNNYLGYWWASMTVAFNNHKAYQLSNKPLNHVLNNPKYNCYVLPSRNIEDCKLKYPELFI